MRSTALFALVAVLVCISGAGSAHPGGLDSSGCHNDRKNGGYHCHSGSSSGSGATAKAPSTPSISGTASVIDADTLDIHGTRVRLHGVDAPESAQTCKDGAGKEYRCGQQAALKLSDFINRRPVACVSRDTDRYGRTVAVCKIGTVDLNEWLVREGWAVAYRQYSMDYAPAEQEAKAAKRGIWGGTFEMPSEFRKKKW